ncbi:MAG: hypothetical protein JWO53_373 [Chlamydiia bacterium]|nr:hypothetical protein [Chlamydiia bacterium]
MSSISSSSKGESMTTSIQRAITFTLSPLFFHSKPKALVKNSATFNFEKCKYNYIFEKCRTFTLSCGALLFGSLTVKQIVTSGILSSATAVSSVACTLFTGVLIKSKNNSYSLALSAYNAMKQSREDEALQYIEKGADIYQKFPRSKMLIGLLTQAIAFECREVICTLAALGYDINQSASYLGHAESLETAQLLVQLGADTNLHNERQFSPLCIQTANLITDKSLSAENINSYDMRCSIIEFLIENGATLRNEPRFREKKKLQGILKRVLEKINSYATVDAFKKETLQKRILKIADSLGLLLRLKGNAIAFFQSVCDDDSDYE